MKTAPEILTEPRQIDWLKNAADPQCRDRVWQLGRLTGLRASEDAVFTPANFERALVLDRIIELRRPQRILEIGTGRGLGCLSMAQSAQLHGAPTAITTIDLFSAETRQRWPLETSTGQEVRHASRSEIWSEYIPENWWKPLRQLTGPTTRILAELAQAREKFDLIFIDAGHDLFSVVHDLSYSLTLLAEDGLILMDDFAPLEEFGLGTCIAAQHARRFFRSVEIFPTEGLVFGGTEIAGAPRGMVLLSGKIEQEISLDRWRLAAWKIAEWILRICHSSRVFPVQVRNEEV